MNFILQNYLPKKGTQWVKNTVPMKTHELKCLPIQLKRKQLKIEKNFHFTEFVLILLLLLLLFWYCYCYCYCTEFVLILILLSDIVISAPIEEVILSIKILKSSERSQLKMPILFRMSTSPSLDDLVILLWTG